MWRLPMGITVSLKRQIIAKQVRSTVRSLHSLYLNFQLSSFLLMKSTKETQIDVHLSLKYPVCSRSTGSLGFSTLKGVVVEILKTSDQI